MGVRHDCLHIRVHGRNNCVRIKQECSPQRPYLVVNCDTSVFTLRNSDADAAPRAFSGPKLLMTENNCGVSSASTSPCASSASPRNRCCRRCRRRFRPARTNTANHSHANMHKHESVYPHISRLIRSFIQLHTPSVWMYIHDNHALNAFI